MKTSKVFTFLTLFPLLVACGNKKPYYVGEYVFQMGKSKDTHLGVSLKLTDELYNQEDADKGNKFELSINMNTSDGESDLMSLLEDFNPVTGFYKINKEEKIYEQTRINVGLNLLGEYELPQELTDLIFVASINKNIVNFYIPVSFTDLSFQLYWYGYDLDLAKAMAEENVPEDGLLATPEGKHPVGTHPTQEDIDTINSHYAADHDGVEYRDYHVLKLGLTKQ